MSQSTPSPELPDLDRLEALARAATPGPWAYQEDSDAYTHIVRPVASPGWIIASATQTSKPEGEANGRWIAAANPTAVLALIALARRAQPEGMSIALREVTDKLAAASAENLSLGMENRQLREQLEARAQPEGEARPTDDKLWDETLRDRDTYQEWADKLAGAIAIHFGVDIGEHSNANCPWHEALEVIESAEPARRAQPEGEAPQAAPLRADHRATIEEAAQVLESAAAHNRTKGRTVLERQQQDRADRLRAILSSPAAQQAAPATANRDAHQLASLLLQDPAGGRMVISSALESGVDGAMWFTATNPETRAAARITISIEHDYDPAAAQYAESGAPVAILTGEQLYTMVTSRFKSGSFPWSMVAESGKGAWNSAAADLTFAPDTIGAALAAQSQGAQARDAILEEAAEACMRATPDRAKVRQIGEAAHYTACRDAIRTLKGDAQQAAAPGALDTDEMTRLRRLMRAIGWDHERDESDRIVRGTLFTVLGEAAGRIERAAAPSAPGTPEAPAGYQLVPIKLPDAIVDQIASAFYDLDDTAREIVREDWSCTLGILRAAQLDGGQGEGASHG